MNNSQEDPKYVQEAKKGLADRFEQEVVVAATGAGIGIETDIEIALYPVNAAKVMINGRTLFGYKQSRWWAAVDLALFAGGIGAEKYMATRLATAPELFGARMSSVEALRLYEIETDLFAIGGGKGPRPAPAAVDFGVQTDADMVGPFHPDAARGASLFHDIGVFTELQMSGWAHKLKAGTKLPEGLGVVADGVDVKPLSCHPRTHHTIFPTKPMTVGEFNALYESLDWIYKVEKINKVKK